MSYEVNLFWNCSTVNEVYLFGMDLEGDSAISLQGYTSLHTFRSHQTNKQTIHGLEITHSSGQLNVSGNPVIPTLSQLALYKWLSPRGQRPAQQVQTQVHQVHGK